MASIFTEHALGAAGVWSKQDAEPRHKRLHVQVANIGIEWTAWGGSAGHSSKAIIGEVDVIVLQAKENIADDTAFEARPDEPSIFALLRMRSDARCY